MLTPRRYTFDTNGFSCLGQRVPKVIVTGTFDNWSKSLPLVKQTDGSFSLQVPLPPKAEDVIYKYVVDGEWRINSDENITKDESGIENNIISKDHLKELIAVPGSFLNPAYL